MERGVREKIAAKYPELLPNKGLSAAERSGDLKWQNLTQEQRLSRADRLRAHLSAANTGKAEKIKNKASQSPSP